MPTPETREPAIVRVILWLMPLIPVGALAYLIWAQVHS